MLKKVIVILVSVFLVGGAAIGFASSQFNEDVDDRDVSNEVKSVAGELNDDDSNDSRVIITAGEAVRIAQGVAEGDSDSNDDDRGNVSSGNGTMINVDQAVSIVRELFENGKIDDIELETKRDRLVYEIEVEFNDNDGDVYIDAFTGEVIYIEDDIRKYAKTTGNVSTNPTRSESRSSVSTPANSEMITPQQAADIALNFVGRGYVDDIELETKNGRLVYEVEVEFGDDDDDVEVYIDVFTGEIVYVDYD
ncbi:PepSY domain-containing protein [Evansella sp. AB-rgal1]|uniref:PepSY domain-containing protein n=1 Tax=Evansella sp. AB-rgal1 TaxID=3242696 RepID=UPI00359D8E77